MQRDPPRHIRDIAHLYLSRAPVPHRRAARLVAAGMSPDVIPGFHVANLALAAASSGMTVRIVEASALPVSAGCFLGLDPVCWVPDGQPPRAVASAFARVSFARTSGACGEAVAAPGGNGAGDVIEIVHAPPFDAGEDQTRVIGGAIDAPTVLLYLAGRDEPPRPWLEWDHVANVEARVAFVARAASAQPGPGCAGVITRWRAALTDPLPPVLRDPGSRLARQYHDLLSTLLAGRPTSSARHAHHHATVPVKPR